MDIFPYAAFGIVATFMAISCLVLCTCAYLKYHVNFGASGSDGDLSMRVPRRSISGDGHRDSFGFSSMGGGPPSSVGPNVSSSSSSGSSKSMCGNMFGNSIIVCQEDGGVDGQGTKECEKGDSRGNEICDGTIQCSDAGGGDGGDFE